LKDKLVVLEVGRPILVIIGDKKSEDSLKSQVHQYTKTKVVLYYHIHIRIHIHSPNPTKLRPCEFDLHHTTQQSSLPLSLTTHVSSSFQFNQLFSSLQFSILFQFSSINLFQVVKFSDIFFICKTWMPTSFLNYLLEEDKHVCLYFLLLKLRRLIRKKKWWWGNKW